MQRPYLKPIQYALIFGLWLALANTPIAAAAETTSSVPADLPVAFTLGQVWFAASGVALILLLAVMFVTNRTSATMAQQ